MQEAESDPPDHKVAGFDCENLRLELAEEDRADSLQTLVERLQEVAEVQGTTNAIQDLLYSRDVLDWDRVEWMVGGELCRNPALLESPASARPLNRMQLSALDIGGPAPLFRLPILNEQYFLGTASAVDLQELRGDYVVVAFWATWCGPCKLEYPVLLALNEKYGEDRLKVVTILFRDSPETAQEWLETRDHPTLPTLVDPDGRVARAYRVGGIPSTVLIDPQGRIATAEHGWRAERQKEIEAFFGELLSGAR